MTQRPAESLASDMQDIIAAAESVGTRWKPVTSVSISLRTVKRWLRLAKSIDARMRLDGSKLNKRKK